MLKKTKFNPAVLSNPRACMTRAKLDGETSMFIPIQPVLMFDALTPSPELTAGQRALAMYRIGELVEKHVMPATGMYDAYFYTNDDQEVKTCSRHGWE